MGALFLSLIILQYVLSVVWLKQQKYGCFILLQMYALFSYDYVFIHASYYLPPLLVAVLKPYTEYLICYFLFCFFVVLRRRFSFSNRTDALMLILLFLPGLLVLLCNDFTGNINPGETLKGLRLYFVPVLLPYLMYRCDILAGYKQWKITNALFCICLLLGLYGCFQRFAFTGHVRSLWFYTFFDQFAINPVAYQPSNFIRNDVLRVTSIFVSPLTYSIALAAPILLIVSIFINEAGKTLRKTKIILAVLGIFFLYCQWMSVTRIGLIIDAIGITMLVALRLRARFLLLAAIPVVIIAATFYTLTSGITKDTSALGRLLQFREFARHFSVRGLGFNNALVQTHFDSFFISIGLLYGALVSFPLLWLYQLNKRAYILAKRQRNYFTAAVFVFSLSFIYTFTFQFVAGAASYKLYFLLLFLIFTDERSSTGTAIQTDPYRIIPNGDHQG